MPSLDDEIDRLYQQPLTSFTAERDALVKRAGSEGGTVRRLQKPSSAAWAVNQVYWQRRKVFERLTTVSARLRGAHERRLGGKTADIDLAEAEHRAAVEAAVNEAAALLRGAGDAATDATLIGVRETFQTLVWSPMDGRLTRPRKATGVEALAALMSGPAPKGKPPAEVIAMRQAERRPAENKAEAAKREADERRKQMASLDRDIRAAKAAEDKAESALERATAGLDQAVKDQSKLETALEKAQTETRERREDVRREQERVRKATTERERLERHRQSLDE